MPSTPKPFYSNPPSPPPLSPVFDNIHLIIPTSYQSRVHLGCLIHRSPLQPLLLACPHLYLLQYLVILPPADPTCQRQVPTVNEHPSIVIIYYLPTIVVYVNAVCSGAPHNTIEGSSGKKTFVDWILIPIVDCCIRTYAYFTHSLSAATAFKEADVDCCVSVPTGVCTIKYHTRWQTGKQQRYNTNNRPRCVHHPRPTANGALYVYCYTNPLLLLLSWLVLDNNLLQLK